MSETQPTIAASAQEEQINDPTTAPTDTQILPENAESRLVAPGDKTGVAIGIPVNTVGSLDSPALSTSSSLQPLDQLVDKARYKNDTTAETEVMPVLSSGIRSSMKPAVQTQARPLATSQFGTLPTNGRKYSFDGAKTDTTAPSLTTTELPSFATASHIANPRHTEVSSSQMGFQQKAPPILMSRNDSYSSNTLSENSKSKQFNQRLDFMIGEFFERQVTKLATNTPESVDRINRIFQQRIREKLGQQWAHVTAQPEVDEAAKEVESMYEYFTQLEKLVERQRQAMSMLNEVGAELSLFYQQRGYQEGLDDLGKHLVHLGTSYHAESKELLPMITALDNYLGFIKTFRAKAIGDTRDTIKCQKTARMEFDSYASKLGYLEEKHVKLAQKNSSSVIPSALRSKASIDTVAYQAKELEQVRQRFQNAKQRYQLLSTQVIDKSGLLEMKRSVDFLAHVEKIVSANDQYCHTRVATTEAAANKLNSAGSEPQYGHTAPAAEST